MDAFSTLVVCFYKRVRIRGMQERYNADVDFRSFVKSAVGIDHNPKEDIEAAIEVLRRFNIFFCNSVFHY